MAHAAHVQDPDKYYIPHGSNLPFFGSVALLVLMAGASMTLIGVGVGSWVLLLGLGLLFALFFLWFGKVVEENQAGLYNMQVDRSFRMGMMWFIISEVMFFAAFFGALFYARQLALPWLGGEGGKAISGILHPGFEATWPTGGSGPGQLTPREDGTFEVMGAWGLPALNTALPKSISTTTPSWLQTERIASPTWKASVPRGFSGSAVPPAAARRTLPCPTCPAPGTG